jgi:teichuronic acid exporter
MSASTPSLADRTARAAPWRFAALVVAAVLQLILTVLLARLIPPAEFGLMALALVVLGGIQPLADLGIGNAIVQRSAITARHVRTAFTFSVLVGLAVAGSAALAAPLAGAVTNNPNVTDVVRWLSIAFASRAIAVVAEALMRRDLDFRRLFVIETSSQVLGYGVVAVSLAVLGYGVWSLVAGAIVQTMVAAGAQLAAVRHAVRPLLGRRELAELLRFGVGAAMTGWVNYVALNGDNFIVGRSLGAASLGLYSRAYALMNLPQTYVAGVMSGVLFPAFSQVQQEPERLLRGYFLVTRLAGMIAGPSMATLAVAAPYLVVSLFGPEWSGMVLPLQVLCVVGYFRALYHLGSVMIQSVGRVYGELARQTVYAILVIAGSVAASSYGLAWIAAAVGAAILYMYVATAQAVLRVTRSGWGPYLRVQRHAAVTAIATCAIALSVRLLLETIDASRATITIGALAAAAVPWSLGVLWELGDPACAAVRPYLPRWCRQLVDALRLRDAASTKASADVA